MKDGRTEEAMKEAAKAIAEFASQRRRLGRGVSAIVPETRESIVLTPETSRELAAIGAEFGASPGDIVEALLGNHRTISGSLWRAWLLLEAFRHEKEAARLREMANP